MKKRNNLFRIINMGAMLLIASSFFSCKSYYELGRVKAKPLSDHKLYRRVVDSSLNFKSFYVKKYSATYQCDGIRKNFKGAMRIQRDSAIWITLTDPLVGVEGARVLITCDSVKFINRIKKEYFAGEFEYLNRQLGLEMDFNTIQSILTNSLFEYCKEDNRSFIRNFRGRVVDNKYVFTSLKKRKFYRKMKKEKMEKLLGATHQRFEIDPLLFRITGFFAKQFDEARDLSIEYSEFKDFDKQKFPQQLLFEVHDPKHLLSCKIKFNKITFNQKLNFNFRISDKYHRISK